MKIVIQSILIGIGAVNCLGSKPTTSSLRGLKTREREISSEIKKEAVNCLIFKIDQLFDNQDLPREEDSNWYCEDEKQLMYRIDGINATYFEENQAVSGETRMKANVTTKVRDSQYDDDHIIVHPSSNIEFLQETNQHRVVATGGTRSLLVIRAVSRDGIPKPANILTADIFGGRNDRVNLVSQMKACSGGKLKFVPAKGNKIKGGVLTVNVPKKFKGVKTGQASNNVKVAAEKMVGSLKKWKYVMIVLQDDAAFGSSVARAYIGGSQSVFKSKMTQNVLPQMHELGHNMGMLHSGTSNSGYGDYTCMMGNAMFADEAPKMCFNGAKSWFLGWYSDRQTSVDPVVKSKWSGKLVGVNDYVQGQTRQGQHYVVIRIVNRKGNDLYIMYNRKEGVNGGVVAHPNKVTVVSAKNSSKRSEKSLLLAGLSRGSVYRQKRFSGNVDLVIKVCGFVQGRPDFAKVLIYLDKKGGKPRC